MFIEQNCYHIKFVQRGLQISVNMKPVMVTRSDTISTCPHHLFACLASKCSGRNDKHASTLIFGVVTCCPSSVQYDNEIGRMARSSKNKQKKIAVCSVMIAILYDSKDLRKKYWCKKWLQRRSEIGSHVTFLLSFLILPRQDEQRAVRWSSFVY